MFRIFPYKLCIRRNHKGKNGQFIFLTETCTWSKVKLYKMVWDKSEFYFLLDFQLFSNYNPAHTTFFHSSLFSFMYVSLSKYKQDIYFALKTLSFSNDITSRYFYIYLFNLINKQYCKWIYGNFL